MGFWRIFFFIFIPFSLLSAKGAELTPPLIVSKLGEVMRAHASYKKLNTQLVSRALSNYLDLLDPSKTYLIEPEIKQWVTPEEKLLEEILDQFQRGDFSAFESIRQTMVRAVLRRRGLEEKIDLNSLPHKVEAREFKNLQWAKSEGELLERLTRLKALQMKAASKLKEPLREKALQRIVKRQSNFEEELINSDSYELSNLLLTYVLKAFVGALDSQTAYFTPEEATQFMISLQQRLFGIGAQLRDDLNGLTIVKIIEGGPAALSKKLKVKDRIIAVNGESIVGLDIVHAVELIQGEKGTPVALTFIRTTKEGGEEKEETIDLTLIRGEVVLKETRYESSYEPFGDGVIAYLRLYSFYQDPENSSAADLTHAFWKLKEEHKIKGVILDLRYNPGGMLSQAVEVAGLFMARGVVVSIKDDEGHVQHLRDLNGEMIWNGPLIILINRGSASAAEIVAQTLQDYGKALIVGDDHSYGKGSFQTFTIANSRNGAVNPEGEYKVTKGRYYTVSGKTPQLVGVLSDIVVPSILSESEVGEKYSKYPLESDSIPDSFNDNFSDIPFLQRQKMRYFYGRDLQSKVDLYSPYLESLRQNSAKRIAEDRNYQALLKELRKKEFQDEEVEEQFGQNDLQLIETYAIMKDLLLLMGA